MAGDGKIILAGDKTSQVSEYLYNGYITASDLGGMLSRPVTPVLSYDEALDKTTLAAATTTAEQAYNPSPHNWAEEVYTTTSRSTTLSWDAGTGAVTHDLYLSTDPLLVAASDPTVKMAGVTSPYAAGGLELGQTYYWQITEADGMSQTHTGQMWSFQVQEYLLVDDFEDYSDTSNLHGTWTDSGSVASSLANLGMKNTPYGNRLVVSLGAGQAGQVSCVPAGSDWTAKNVKGLYVNVYGSNANDANAKLSVTLNDMATITYAGSLLDENWTTWKIPLADFGLDLSSVTKLAFVFDNANGVMALAGYIDDIRLVPEECIAPPAADLNGDCKVDFSDLSVLIDDWMASGLTVP